MKISSELTVHGADVSPHLKPSHPPSPPPSSLFFAHHVCLLCQGKLCLALEALRGGAGGQTACWAFATFDGHAGPACSHFLKENFIVSCPTVNLHPEVALPYLNEECYLCCQCTDTIPVSLRRCSHGNAVKVPLQPSTRNSYLSVLVTHIVHEVPRSHSSTQVLNIRPPLLHPLHEHFH